MEDKDKPLLSHTVSLPSPGHSGGLALSSEGDRHSIGGVPTPTQKSEPRSKSVRQKATTNNKVWSFGDMAKAVGCGVTAFGSNVVSGSKAVGSGVYHSSRVVGSGVVEGTKAAGKMTKDLTIATGKGVVEVGEHMALSTVEVGKVVTSASVTAVQDTTNWIIEQTDLEAGGSGGSVMIGPGVQNVHVVLPGEDLAELSKVYSVPAHKLIKVNSLRHRKLIPGKEIIIPKRDSQDSAEPHPMTSVTLSCVIDTTGERAKVVFTVKHVVVETLANFSRSNSHNSNNAVAIVDVVDADALAPATPDVGNGGDSFDASSSVEETGSGRMVSFECEDDQQDSHQNRIRMSWRKIKFVMFKKVSSDDEIPELLSVDDIPECVVHEEDSNSHHHIEDCSANAAADVRLTFLDQDDQTLTKIRLSSNHIGQINSYVTLWYPEKIHEDSDFTLLTRPRFMMTDSDEYDEDTNPFVFEDLICNSQILSKSLMEDLHAAMNLKTQSSKWRIVYSTILDGYSLKNFYRKVAPCNEPFLLVIQSDEDEIFGAFLTCVPTITDEFIGTGESWLFGVTASNADAGGVLKTYEWSKENEYFFQGKTNCVIIGACDGKFGIYMDGNLHHGRLDRCGTFEGWPEQIKDMKVKCFECFNFE